MTKNRDFKKLVRARMARTGERYAAARAQLARDEETPAAAAPGRHPETAALARMLDAAGIRAPGGGAVSEALLLGLGGGLGAACFVFEYKGHTPTFYVATRCQPQYAYDPAFVRTAAERLGAACDVAESASAAPAAKKLAARLAGGPQMAWLDLGALPWARRMGPIGELGAMPHVVVVESINGDVATVRDLAASPYELDVAALARARARLRNGKFRLMAFRAADEAPDPRDAVRDAIAACAAELRGKTKIRGPMAKNFGIPGLERWAAAMRAPARDKGVKAWARVFPPAGAASVLTWLRHWIEHAGTGGGGFRPMYAEFLDEAAAIARLPALRALAKDYRALGAAWRELADAALPANVPALAAIRKAQDDRHAAFARGDERATRRAEDAMFAFLDAARAAPPLDDAALAAHYAALAARLDAIVADETACAERLANAVT
jgi:hypothetical protein